MFPNIDLTTIPAAELAEIAAFYRIPLRIDASDPAAAIIDAHDPTLARIVAALWARREEVAAFIAAHTPDTATESGAKQ